MQQQLMKYASPTVLTAHFPDGIFLVRKKPLSKAMVFIIVRKR